MSDWKFWVNAAISMAAVLATLWEKSPAPQQSTVAAVGSATVVASYWPLGLMGALVVMNMGLLIAQKRKPKGPFLRGSLIVGYGSRPLMNLYTLNCAALSDFKEKYNVAMVIGFDDPTADKYEDERISKSEQFTLSAERRDVMIPYQPAMKEPLDADIAKLHVQQALVDAPRPGFRKTQAKKKSARKGMVIEIKTWAEAVLVVKHTDLRQIRKLSDVRRVKGLIISEELAEGRIKPSV